jgi:putative pyruvate formate lyase activating enzyme
MKQFFPAHEAASVSGIHRKLTDGEYGEAIGALEEAGLENGWVQE